MKYKVFESITKTLRHTKHVIISKPYPVYVSPTPFTCVLPRILEGMRCCYSRVLPNEAPTLTPLTPLTPDPNPPNPRP